MRKQVKNHLSTSCMKPTALVLWIYSARKNFFMKQNMNGRIIVNYFLKLKFNLKKMFNINLLFVLYFPVYVRFFLVLIHPRSVFSVWAFYRIRFFPSKVFLMRLYAYVLFSVRFFPMFFFPVRFFPVTGFLLQLRYGSVHPSRKRSMYGYFSWNEQ